MCAGIRLWIDLDILKAFEGHAEMNRKPLEGREDGFLVGFK